MIRDFDEALHLYVIEDDFDASTVPKRNVVARCLAAALVILLLAPVASASYQASLDLPTGTAVASYSRPVNATTSMFLGSVLVVVRSSTPDPVGLQLTQGNVSRVAWLVPSYVDDGAAQAQAAQSAAALVAIQADASALKARLAALESSLAHQEDQNQQNVATVLATSDTVAAATAPGVNVATANLVLEGALLVLGVLMLRALRQPIIEFASVEDQGDPDVAARRDADRAHAHLYPPSRRYDVVEVTAVPKAELSEGGPA